MSRGWASITMEESKVTVRLNERWSGLKSSNIYLSSDSRRSTVNGVNVKSVMRSVPGGGRREGQQPRMPQTIRIGQRKICLLNAPDTFVIFTFVWFFFSACTLLPALFLCGSYAYVWQLHDAILDSDHV